MDLPRTTVSPSLRDSGAAPETTNLVPLSTDSPFVATSTLVPLLQQQDLQLALLVLSTVSIGRSVFNFEMRLVE